MFRILKRFAIRYLYFIFRLYWFIRRPHTKGVKCLVLHDSKVLLTKLNYGHRRWTVPGGGVRKNEPSEKAAHREVFEETGVVLTSVKQIGSYSQIIEYKNDTVDVYSGEAVSPTILIDELEIAEAHWFPLTDLPSDRSPQTDKIIAMYLSSLK